ncbi:MAG: hypothetical protein U0031_05660 [Thermomicrobiales bacterium]
MTAAPNVAFSLDGLSKKPDLLPVGVSLVWSGRNGGDGRVTFTLSRNRGLMVAYRELDETRSAGHHDERQQEHGNKHPGGADNTFLPGERHRRVRQHGNLRSS